MTNRELLEQYIPLVDFLGNAMGPFTEVALNDVSTPYKAVMAIYNGHLSGRTVGSPATDYSINVLHSDEYRDHNYAVRYKAQANGKTFLSSTYYIKNPQGDLIGLLCINTDISPARDLLTSIDRFMESTNLSPFFNKVSTEEPPQENLNTPIASLAKSIILKTVEKYGVSPERMTREEKIMVVQELSNQGVAGIKGSVSEIAKQLCLSESTVYRYLSLKNS